MTQPRLTNSRERLIPAQASGVFDERNLELHLERYTFAAQHAHPTRLLDMACGVGYGTNLLAQKIGEDFSEIVGIDLSTDALDYARQQYAHPKIRFIHADATVFEDAAGFDTIISLETIEHVNHPQALVKRLVGLLRPGGVLIASVPTTPSVDANPYHMHDFTEASFRKMFAPYALVEIARLNQKHDYNPFSAGLAAKEERMNDHRRNLPFYYLTHPTGLWSRLLATIRYGFSNHYITIVWQKPE